MDDKVENIKQLNFLKREQSLTKHCSCSDCDSRLCFTKSRLAVKCSCDDCTKSNVCLNYSKQNGVLEKTMKENYSDLINSIYLNKSMYPKSHKTDLEEILKSDINFELERQRVIEANLPKTVRSTLTHQQKHESLKKCIDITSGNDRNKSEQSTLNIDNRKVTEIQCEKPLENVNSHITLLVNKLFTKLPETCFCECKRKDTNCKKCRHKNSEFEKCTQIQSLVLSPDFKNLNPRTAKLSTQVMDLPCNNLSVSDISKTSEISSEDKNFKYEFLKRLEEVYKACSCKVCECIPTKLSKNEICNCKPCECVDCKSYMIKSEANRASKQSLYSYGKYNSENKNNVPDKWRNYSGKPCNYVRNNDTAESCDCKPCQCINCKQMVPQMQVLFGETQQNSPCQCLPCNCTECLRTYTDTTKDLMHEVSTTTSSQSDCRCDMCSKDTCMNGLVSCRCYNKNIIRKPFEMAIHGYDIRATTINNDIYHYDTERNESEKQKMIDMFTALPHDINSDIKIRF